jgi:hypothetical protein
MQLDSTDARVLDSIADDHYGLWEIADYFAQLRPAMGRNASDKRSRIRMTQYVQAGFANVFVGNFQKGVFEKAADELALLKEPASWQRPTSITDVVVAARATPEAEAPVANAWPKSELR